MTSDVVLSAALRNNLLSLQNTATGIASAQLKLSTGKKVNSALDNPQSFFAAQSLTNRASDLNRLLDGIGQSIEVIKAADNGVTALTNLINQANSIVTQAQNAFSAANSGTAKIVGNVDLSKLVTIVGAGGIAVGDGFTVTTYNSTGAVGTSNAIAVAANDTAAQFAQKITTAFAGAAGKVVGSLDANGFLNIEATTAGYSMRIDTLKFAGAVTLAAQQTGAAALGLSNEFGIEEESGGATQKLAATVFAGNSVTSHALTSGGNVATLNSQISGLTGTAAFAGVSSNADTFTVSAAGQTLTFNTFGSTIGDLVNQINSGPLTGLVNASFDAVAGKITLTATSSAVTNITVGAGTAASATFAFGFGSNKTGAAVVDSITEAMFLGNTAASSTLTSLQTQYNSTRGQIDALVQNGDTGYQGTNLLDGNNLITTFNEGGTSTLTTTGVTYNSAGLGLSAATFTTQVGITAASTATSNALATVRNFGSGLAANLSVIQTRQDFTNNLINTLKEGAGQLVNADQNEEGATLLALQTRQSLGVTALSLASQSNQSILRLFQ